MKNPAVIFADLSDILFENRNREYGSYQLRKQKERHLGFAFLASATVALLFVLGFFLTRTDVQLPDPGKGIHELSDEFLVLPIDIPEVEEPEQDEPEQDEQQQEELAQGTDTDEFLNPNPVDDADPNATIQPQDSLDGNPDTVTQKGADDGVIGNPGDGTGDIVNKKDSVDVGKKQEGGPKLPDWKEVFLGEMPIAQNMRDVKSLIGYPRQAKDLDMDGSVTVRVLVDETGAYDRHIVLKTSHKIFTQAVERELDKLKFTPGKQNGRNVKVWVTIPFIFKLHK